MTSRNKFELLHINCDHGGSAGKEVKLSALALSSAPSLNPAVSTLRIVTAKDQNDLK